MNKYQSHKVVEAFKIVNIALVGNNVTLNGENGNEEVINVTQEYIDRAKPQVGGYFVRYEDGFCSWSPAKAFEAGYTLKT